MSLRRVGRAVRFGGFVGRAAIAILVSKERPCRLLHRNCQRLLGILGVQLEVTGPVPTAGLLVCNHLSYLDIVVIAAVTPARFVAKDDVKTWPIFGWFARRAGTIFVERDRPASAAGSVDQINAALQAGDLVVLFPEGTSSDGETVLPFKSALLESGVGRPVHAAALEFELEPDDGDPAEEVCYWKDMRFGPHLARLLGKRTIRARLVFAPQPALAADRKDLAVRLHSVVANLPRKRRRTPGAGFALRLT
jgi:1-acyl-sn-glycerol-3-phosphate acyltransferase